MTDFCSEGTVANFTKKAFVMNVIPARSKMSTVSTKHVVVLAAVLVVYSGVLAAEPEKKVSSGPSAQVQPPAAASSQCWNLQPKCVSAVVPAVRQWNGKEGMLELKNLSVRCANFKEHGGEDAAKILADDAAHLGLGNWTITDKPDASITLKTSKVAESESSDAYTIDIGDTVVITGATPAGVFYGTRTLLQTLSADRTRLALPRGTLVDWPACPRRGLMLDVGRAPFPMKELYRYLKLMSWYKMNELHLHLNDVVRPSGYSAFRMECNTVPELTAKDCHYTKKEMKEFQAAARMVGITVVPEIDMPGHSRCFTQIWPELTYPHGKNRNYLDVTKPETAVRLKRLLDEMIPVFDGPDFHIGTDEYRIGGWPNGAEFKRMNDELMKFANDMSAHVRLKGKNCRMWYGYDHAQSKVRPDPATILDLWQSDFPQSANWLATYRVINSNEQAGYIVPGRNNYIVDKPAVYQHWQPWMFEKKEAWPQRRTAEAISESKPQLYGAKLHVWMDVGPDRFSPVQIMEQVIPCLQVFAEKMWGVKGSADYADFQRRGGNLISHRAIE